MQIDDFIHNFSQHYPEEAALFPWEITSDLTSFLEKRIPALTENGAYTVKDNIAIHYTAIIERNVTIKGPAIIGPLCHIAANAYLREGIHLVEKVKIGPGCEVKSSIVFGNTALAHFNYIGNSIIGNHVNFEAGAIAANHYNERSDKRIAVMYKDEIIKTSVQKFGTLTGDHTKVGANAVLSPGTILHPDSIVKRLDLIEQVKSE